MLVNPKQWLERAVSDEFAVAAFTAESVECAEAAMLAAEEVSAPIIIEVDEDTATFYGLKPLAAMLGTLAEEVDCPVALHLSYARRLPFVQACVEAGFTSVAIDNRGQAEEIVRYAKDRNVWVEGLSTSMDEATALAEIGVEALSIKIQTIPGAFTGREYLQFGFLGELEEQFPQIPLSVRGTAGLAPSHVKQLTESHVSKIVVGSEFASPWLQGKSREAAREVVKTAVAEKIRLFGAEGQGTL